MRRGTGRIPIEKLYKYMYVCGFSGKADFGFLSWGHRQPSAFQDLVEENK